MDGMQEPRKATCGWCQQDATRTILLRAGRGLRMPQTAPVCDAHFEHFHTLDEVGERADGADW